LPATLRLQGGDQGACVVRPDMAAVTDEEGRSASYATGCGTLDVLGDQALCALVLQVVHEAFQVQLQCRRVREQVIERQCFLMLEESLVHVPEPALPTSGLRSTPKKNTTIRPSLIQWCRSIVMPPSPRRNDNSVCHGST
jgi:hypothetical protein